MNPKHYRDEVEIVTQACMELGHSEQECRMIGVRSAELWSKKHGGEYIRVPLNQKMKLNKRKAQIRRDLQTMDDSQILDKYGISRRTLARNK